MARRALVTILLCENTLAFLVVAFLTVSASLAVAQSAPKGHLLVIGGNGTTDATSSSVP